MAKQKSVIKYRIRNSDGYNYRDSSVEITGKYETEKQQWLTKKN